MDSMSGELEERVNAELRPGERLVWSGNPLPGRFMRMAIPIFLLGIPFTAFALFWEAMAIGILGSPKAPAAGGFKIVSIIFPLFGLPFIVIGFAMLTSPFCMRMRAQRIGYALTSERAMIWDSGLLGYQSEVRSFNASALGKMARREFADGSGDLIFEDFTYMPGRRMQRIERGFLGIENVREVEELIRSTLLKP